MQVEQLMSTMTVKQKVAQLNQHLYGWQCYKVEDGQIVLSELFKNHVKELDGIGAIYGLLRADPWSQVSFQNGLNLKQSQQLIGLINNYVIENTTHQIKPLIVEEIPHGHQGLNAISYPVNLAVAATFNPELYAKQITEVSKFGASLGINVGLVSGLDVCRNTKWGRTEETFGSDPYLSSSFMRKVGQALDCTKFTVCLKHFAAQGDPYLGLNSAAVNIGERELHEIHLPPAKAAVESGIKMVMAAYNEIDGIPCHANKKLLTEILRERWGFDGLVMADGLALNRLVSKNISKPHASSLAIKAGVNLSLWDDVFLTIEDAIANQYLTIEQLDDCVYKVLSLKQSLGLLDEADDQLKEVETESATVNYDLAKESIILQKNIDNYLPLCSNQRTLVIGDLIDDIYTFLGDYTPYQTEGKYPTLKQVLTDELEDYQFSEINDALDLKVEELASFDKVIVCGGGTSTRNFNAQFLANGALLSNYKYTDSGENVDVKNIKLPREQYQICKYLTSLDIDYCFITIGGRPYALENIYDTAKSIITAYYGGQQGPKALAKVILGEVNPSGKNPITVPKLSEYNQYEYNNKQDNRNQKFKDTEIEVFEFGHGLSYSLIKYHHMTVDVRTSIVKVKCKIENCSSRRAHETVQVYVQKANTIVTKRQRELITYRKEVIEPNEKLDIEFKIDFSSFESYGIDGKWILESGEYKIIIGTGTKSYLEETIYL